jgi:hypothetical protein
MIASISQGDLQKWLPTAIDPTAEIYEQLVGHLETADAWLSAYLLGGEQAKSLASLFASGDEGEALPMSPFRLGATLAEVKEEWVATVVYTAFANAIPMLDLVLTPNGFGVVSTNQVAPASRERVTALRQSCMEARALHLDNLLLALPGCKETEALALASEVWRHRTATFLRTTSETRHFVAPTSDTTRQWTMEEYWSWCPMIATATASLYRSFSREQMEALITAMQESTADDVQRYVIRRIRLLIGAMFGSDVQRLTVHPSTEEIIAFMEDHEESFQPYVSSKIYAARHASRYESAKEDPCYFF